MKIDSPVEITEQEAIDTVEELWSRLFCVETKIDTDDFYTDRGMKRTSENSNEGTPTKSSWDGMAGNSDPLPSGYSRGTCDECVEIVLKKGHKHGKKVVPHNWGLLLYIKKANPEEVRDIEDQIGEYLAEVTKTPSKRRLLTCFVCGRQARGNTHNIKDCIQIANVSLQANGRLRYAKAMRRPLNTCVKGFHSHQTYVEQLQCATNGDGRFAVIKKFVELERKGATPCRRCGDVFPTHGPRQCPNYSLSEYGGIKVLKQPTMHRLWLFWSDFKQQPVESMGKRLRQMRVHLVQSQMTIIIGGAV